MERFSAKDALKNYVPVNRGILDNCSLPKIKIKMVGNKERATPGSFRFLFQLNNIIRASLEDYMHVLILKLYSLQIRTGLTRGKKSWYQFGRHLLPASCFPTATKI